MISYIDKDEIFKRKNSRFSYDIEEINFLNLMNEKLFELEEFLTREDVKEEFINIWVLGLPRSGTTLLTQVIFNCLDIACTNNLIARFWSVPLVGTKLSRIILKDSKSDSFESEYGKTKDIRSPHEFSWFWRKLLKIEDIENYNVDNATKLIDWQMIKKKILNMNKILEKGIVFKPLEFVGYHLKNFDNLFNKAIFIYIERDVKSVALSLAKTRLDYYNDLQIWWGSFPLEFNEIKNRAFADQIAGQIYYLRKMYESGFEQINNKRLLRLTYWDLCNNPSNILDSLIEKAYDLYSEKINYVNKPPKKFNYSSGKKLEKEIENKIVESLKRYNLLDSSSKCTR